MKTYVKNQAWKIIFFFHTNRSKKFFSTHFQTGKSQIFFHVFQDCVGTLTVQQG